MLILILILVVLLALTGSLVAVLKVALGVAVGLFLGILLLGALGAWWLRRKWRRALGEVRLRRFPPGSSTVDVLPPRSPQGTAPRDLTRGDDGLWSAGDESS